MIRWGIVGCGAVTERKSGPAFQKAKDSSLIAVMRRDGAGARDYARRHGVPLFFDDAQRLIEHPEVDAVYIATPPGSHRDLALRVCAAGKPAYVEKPMARNHREASEMVEAFAEKGVPLFVAYYRRKLDRFVQAKAILAERLGSVERIAVEYRGSQQHDASQGKGGWRTDPQHSGGGIFLDLACHTLDILDFWFGPLLRVAGSARRASCGRGPEDTIELAFETGSGARGQGAFTYADPPGTPRTDRISVVGANAELTLSTFGSEPLELRTADGVTHFDLSPPEHIQQPLIQSIVDALHGRGQCPSDGNSAARTSGVIDHALASFYGGRDDAFWERPETWPAPSGPLLDAPGA